MQNDDDLQQFEADGAPVLPRSPVQGFVTHDGARIWYAAFGHGPAVILLHGGLGSSGNWGKQVPALIAAGYRPVVIDSRGHGRSSRDSRPYTYHLMAGDVRAVMDEIGIEKAAFIGWSDGACTSMILADEHPERVAGVYFFACNMDPSGTKPFEFTAIVGRCYNRQVADYAALSPTPGDFQEFSEAVGLMQRTEPNYSATDLGRIRVPVTYVLGEFDEFITPEHIAFLAANTPGASRIELPGVSHFAPLQRPEQFNATVLSFLAKTLPAR